MSQYISRKPRWLLALQTAAVFAGAAALIAVLAMPAGHAGRSSENQQTAALPPLPPHQAAALTRSLYNGDGLEFTAPLPPRERRRTVEARRGDTFMKLIRSAGATRAEAYEAIEAMRPVFDPRGLAIGQPVTAVFQIDGDGDGDDDKGRFAGFRFQPDVAYSVAVTRGGDGFAVRKIPHALALRDVRIAGAIESSLYTGAVGAGMAPSVLVEMIRLLSWDVDFQRDVQPGDSFDVLLERYDDEGGELARWGNILRVELVLSGKALRYYRYETDRHGVEYFDDEGRSAAKALMKTPIDGARLSSGYGKRRHPILGYTRMHRGVDFAAPRGTPIYAAGNGTVDFAGRNGGYGRYIRIRHNGRYATAYAHMKGFARGIRRGKRVRQGQVIGYVGTTGRSTGPHLHYEVMVRGSQVNPLKLDLPSGRTLEGTELAAFTERRAALDRRLAALPRPTVTASR